MTRLDPDLLGPCMLYCGYCGVHLKGKCDGCGPMTRKRAREGAVFCVLAECASKRGVKKCADCDDYPCARFDLGSAEDHALFSKEFTAYLRENCR